MRLLLTYIGMTQRDEPWASPPDLAQDFRLILVQEGHGIWTVDGHTHLLVPGSMIYIKPNQMRHARMAPKQTVRYWGLRLSPGKDLSSPLPSWLVLPSFMQLRSDTLDVVEEILREIADESREKRAHYLDAVDALARRLFISLSRTYADRIASPLLRQGSDERSGVGALAFDEVIHFIHDHLGERIDVRRLADVAGMSETHFRRTFRRLTGQSPHQYVTEARMWRAKELLSVGGFYIYEVARAVGYDDSLYFSRVFRKVVGVPPTHYGKRHSTRARR